MAMKVRQTSGPGGTQAYKKLDTRQRAIENGDNTYWSPNPCRRAGHVGLRRTAGGKCITCERLRDKEEYDKRTGRNREPEKVQPVPRSLGAFLASKVNVDLTPSNRVMEPQCQPLTKQK